MLQPIVPFFGAVALTVIFSVGGYRLRLSEVRAAAPAIVWPLTLEFGRLAGDMDGARAPS